MENYDIFISYRRDGGEALACLLCEKLRQRSYNVFYDVDSLRSGKFNEEIYRIIQNCNDVICILPEHGLDRCQSPSDWVRREIAFAISAEKNIIPIMMRNFEFPSNLPEDIDELRNYQGINATMEYFDAAFEKLLEMLHQNDLYTNNEVLKRYFSVSTLEKINKYNEEIRLHKSVSAMYEIAQIYYNLDSQAGDLNEDMYRLCLKAAEKGNRDAQYLLGLLYKDGRGTEKNYLKAFEWFYKSALMGNAKACAEIYACFHTGKTNELLACKWLEKAILFSQQDDTLEDFTSERYNEIHNLCVMYGTGKDVPQNMNLANYYLQILPAEKRVSAMWEIAKFHDKNYRKKKTSYPIADDFFERLLAEGELKAKGKLGGWHKFWRSLNG